METSTRRRCSVSAAPHCNPHLADLDVAFDSSRMVVKPVPSLALGAYLWSSRTVLFFFFVSKNLDNNWSFDAIAIPADSHSSVCLNVLGIERSGPCSVVGIIWRSHCAEGNRAEVEISDAGAAGG
jgi:hypothetical protein